MTEKIVAVVVTYNRLTLLKESILALKQQTHKLDGIIVFNNNSTDSTKAYLDQVADDFIHPIHSDINVGGAGGFFYGIKNAYESGADWIWVMDDDSIPDRNALDKIVNSVFFPFDESGNITGYFASRVDWIDGTRHLMNYIQPHFPWNHFHGIHENVYRIHNCSFVGMLISRQAVKKCGYPVKEFFIWGDDWEYSGRISKKFMCYYISDSVVVHKTKSNSPAHVDKINENNYWKFRYAARNMNAIRTKSFFGFLQFNINLMHEIKIMLDAKIRIRYLAGYIFHSYKGFFYDYEKEIRYPD